MRPYNRLTAAWTTMSPGGHHDVSHSLHSTIRGIRPKCLGPRILDGRHLSSNPLASPGSLRVRLLGTDTNSYPAQMPLLGGVFAIPALNKQEYSHLTMFLVPSSVARGSTCDMPTEKYSWKPWMLLVS